LVIVVLRPCRWGNAGIGRNNVGGIVLANVLIGIVGVILFIGLALAGASFFGPVLSDAVVESRASGVVQSLSTVAKAVSVRNRELETLTSASATSSVLVPEYLEDLPTNPVNGGPIILVSSDGRTSGTGMARLVLTRLSSLEVPMCTYINRQGGGSDALVVVSAMPAQSIGCVRMGAAVGDFASGDMFAYMTIN
jgi:hypothetical protein